jgi:hypothetical protein
VRARGVLQVMVLFQMDDGQTVSIWFHNPDTTPAKLTPLDELVSWKWMLNKKDVTIVVAPERGKELNIREVARRVMRLVEKNSVAFKRANEKSTQRVQQVADLKAEISVLEVELSDWQRKIEVTQMEQAEAPTPKERWDSARGHANAVNKAVREEMVNGMFPQDPTALASHGHAGRAARPGDRRGARPETPEALRAQVDELAVAIRAKARGRKGPGARARPQTRPRPAPWPSATDSVLAGLGVSREDIAAMEDDGGYAAIIEDEKLALKWQDVLDAAMEQRAVDVRNALRSMGWKGSGTTLSKDIDGSVYGIRHLVKQIGAGKNAVQVIWVLNEATNVPDDLQMKAPDMASHLEATLREQIATAQAAIAAEPVAEPPKSPTDAELEAAAKAGAEVKSVARNLADPKTKDMVPRAHLRTEDGTVSVALWTDSDVTRAVRAVHDAEDMANYRPFDPSVLKMPTAVQLGINKRNTVVLPISDDNESVTLSGWSNGHLMDFTQRPPFVEKALTKYFGELTSPMIRRYPVSKIEKIETAAKSRGTKVEPIASHEFERIENSKKPGQTVPVHSVILANADGSVWVAVDVKYLAYFWKTYKGCQFFADGPDVSVGVRQHGKLVGVLMPMRSDNETLARAQRVKAGEQVAKDPDALTPAVVDAAYKFDDASDAFKIAVAHSVNDTSYSPFLTARTMDERAKAAGPVHLLGHPVGGAGLAASGLR